MTIDDKLDLILRILKQHDKQFEQIDKRFEQIDKRFEQIDKRFEQIEKRLDRIENIIEKDRDKLQEVYEARNKVKITFGWQWGMASLFIAFLAATMTKFFG